ncbi:unnamed protein product [Schistocephalus solidus]|uniref:Secreted protein n=1 Tax=Schistocephalus solidus TaxID=70667 RepID=A0A183SB61_SCHSO|nr:unnamed protein product [Schistocephalus solidus]
MVLFILIREAVSCTTAKEPLIFSALTELPCLPTKTPVLQHWVKHFKKVLNRSSANSDVATSGRECPPSGARSKSPTGKHLHQTGSLLKIKSLAAPNLQITSQHSAKRRGAKSDATA